MRFVLSDAGVTTAGRHPASDIFLDDITVSRATPRSSAVADGTTPSATSARSTALTSTVSASTRRHLQNGDEVQIGKFKLVFFWRGRAMAYVSDRVAPVDR